MVNGVFLKVENGIFVLNYNLESLYSFYVLRSVPQTKIFKLRIFYKKIIPFTLRTKVWRPMK